MPHDPSRRLLLKMCSATVAGSVLGCSASDENAPAAFGDVTAGTTAEVPVGAVTRVGASPVFIARDAQGLYALTTTCTHRGCDVAVQGTGANTVLACPCHGSRFDPNGAVLTGPAPAPLAHFQVTVDASGTITVHGATQVAADVRVAV